MKNNIKTPQLYNYKMNTPVSITENATAVDCEPVYPKEVCIYNEVVQGLSEYFEDEPIQDKINRGKAIKMLDGKVSQRILVWADEAFIEEWREEWPAFRKPGPSVEVCRYNEVMGKMAERVEATGIRLNRIEAIAKLDAEVSRKMLVEDEAEIVEEAVEIMPEPIVKQKRSRRIVIEEDEDEPTPEPEPEPTIPIITPLPDVRHLFKHLNKTPTPIPEPEPEPAPEPEPEPTRWQTLTLEFPPVSAPEPTDPISKKVHMYMRFPDNPDKAFPKFEEFIKGFHPMRDIIHKPKYTYVAMYSDEEFMAFVHYIRGVFIPNTLPSLRPTFEPFTGSKIPNSLPRFIEDTAEGWARSIAEPPKPKYVWGTIRTTEATPIPDYKTDIPYFNPDRDIIKHQYMSIDFEATDPETHTYALFYSQAEYETARQYLRTKHKTQVSEGHFAFFKGRFIPKFIPKTVPH